jgi:hypothetical protein
VIDEDEHKHDANGGYKKERESPNKKPILFTASGDAVYEAEGTSDPKSQKRQPQESFWRKVKRKDAAFWQAFFTALTFAGTRCLHMVYA